MKNYKGGIGVFIFLMVISPCIFLLSFQMINLLMYYLSIQLSFVFQFWLSFQLVFLIGLICHFVHGRKQPTFFDHAHAILNDLANGNFPYSRVEKLKKAMRVGGEWTLFFNEMEETFHNLAEMERVKQEFISDVSHEIKTPLTSIIGFSQLAQKSTISNEKKEHYMKMIQQEAMRLNVLSTNLLALSDLENMKNGIEKSSVFLDSQIKKCIVFFEPQIKKKELTVITQFDPVEYKENEVLMQQIWQNLIQNAVKFSEKGSKIFIQVKLVEASESFQVRIKDQGVGLAPSERIRIFERFYKADNSRSQNKGHGLGLAIVAKIIELHQDLKISVESNLGKGTEFIIEGPIAIKKAREKL